MDEPVQPYTQYVTGTAADLRWERSPMSESVPPAALTVQGRAVTVTSLLGRVKMGPEHVEGFATYLEQLANFVRQAQ